MILAFLEEVHWIINIIQWERVSSDIWDCFWQLRACGMKKDDIQWIRWSLGFETGTLLHTQTHTAVHSQVPQQHHSPQEPTQWYRAWAAPQCSSLLFLRAIAHFSPLTHGMGAGQLQNCVWALALAEHVANGTVLNWSSPLTFPNLPLTKIYKNYQLFLEPMRRESLKNSSQARHNVRYYEHRKG